MAFEFFLELNTPEKSKLGVDIEEKGGWVGFELNRKVVRNRIA